MNDAQDNSNCSKFKGTTVDEEFSGIPRRLCGGEVHFNTHILGLTAANITNISAASPAYSAVVNYNSIAADGFGKYDISLQKTGPHNVSELTFDLINVGLGKTVDDFIQLSSNPAGNGYGHFAAEIIGDPTAPTFFARDGGTETDPPDTVPEPSTFLLFVGGLLGLGFFRFKK